MKNLFAFVLVVAFLPLLVGNGGGESVHPPGSAPASPNSPCYQCAQEAQAQGLTEDNAVHMLPTCQVVTAGSSGGSSAGAGGGAGGATPQPGGGSSGSSVGPTWAHYCHNSGTLYTNIGTGELCDTANAHPTSDCLALAHYLASPAESLHIPPCAGGGSGGSSAGAGSGAGTQPQVCHIGGTNYTLTGTNELCDTAHPLTHPCSALVHHLADPVFSVSIQPCPAPGTGTGGSSSGDITPQAQTVAAAPSQAGSGYTPRSHIPTNPMGLPLGGSSSAKGPAWVEPSLRRIIGILDDPNSAGRQDIDVEEIKGIRQKLLDLYGGKKVKDVKDTVEPRECFGAVLNQEQAAAWVQGFPKDTPWLEVAYTEGDARQTFDAGMIFMQFARCAGFALTEDRFRMVYYKKAKAL